MNKSQRLASAFSVVALLSTVVPGLSAAVTAATTTTSSTSTTTTLVPRFRNGDSPLSGEKRYIIRYADSETDESEDDELTKNNGRLKSRLSKVFNGAIADLTPAKASQLRKSSKILWVEEDKGVATQTTVSPTPSWGLDRIDQRTNTATNSYSFATNGAGVTVYVIDTGIYTSHSQFTGRTRLGFDAFGVTELIPMVTAHMWREPLQVPRTGSRLLPRSFLFECSTKQVQVQYPALYLALTGQLTTTSQGLL